MKRIRIGKIIAKVGKWSYGFSIEPDYQKYKGTRFSIWFFKLKKMPDESSVLDKKYLFGFHWSFAILFDFHFSIYK